MKKNRHNSLHTPIIRYIRDLDAKLHAKCATNIYETIKKKRKNLEKKLKYQSSSNFVAS